MHLMSKHVKSIIIKKNSYVLNVLFVIKPKSNVIARVIKANGNLSLSLSDITAPVDGVKHQFTYSLSNALAKQCISHLR